MCLYPVRQGDHDVACRNCWQCREKRVASYTGRCLAEQQTSDYTVAVTLTYGTNHPHSQFLVYSDIQKMLKRLRKAGLNVRYIVAGEYGAKFRRAHWHCVLFLRGDVDITGKKGQPIQYNENVQWPFWPHGHCYFQHPDVKGFRYLLKYVLKDTRESIRLGHFGLSKLPPLGQSFFIQLGRDYGTNGWLPPNPLYALHGQTYELHSRSRDALLRAYAVSYLSAFGHTPLILPEWALDHVNKDETKWIGYFDEKRQTRHQPFSDAFYAEVYNFCADNPRSALRRTIVAEDTIRIASAAWANAGSHVFADTCGCASCRVRRQSEATLARRLPFEAGFSGSKEVREAAGPLAYRKNPHDREASFGDARHQHGDAYAQLGVGRRPQAPASRGGADRDGQSPADNEAGSQGPSTGRWARRKP